MNTTDLELLRIARRGRGRYPMIFGQRYRPGQENGNGTRPGPRTPPEEWARHAIAHLAETGRAPLAMLDELHTLVRMGAETLDPDELGAALGVSKEHGNRRLRNAGVPSLVAWALLGRHLVGIARLEHDLEDPGRLCGLYGVVEQATVLKKWKNHLGLTYTEIKELPEPKWRGIADAWWRMQA